MEMCMLHLDVVDTVPIREHLPEVHHVQRRAGASGCDGF